MTCANCANCPNRQMCEKYKLKELEDAEDLLGDNSGLDNLINLDSAVEYTANVDKV